MKKILFLILVILLFSCEKPKEKEKCWICIDQNYNSAINTLVICDPVQAAEQNSHKHYKDAQGLWHNWECTPQ